MSRDRILAYFEEHKGEVVPGNELALLLGITRSAVWKSVQQLRQEGYDITSLKRTGYRLEENSDILSEVKIRSGLSAPLKNARIAVYKSVDSTNLQIKLAALKGDGEWTIAASEEQTKGRGHRQREYPSPSGKGVYLSVLLRPRGLSDPRRELPMLAALAVCSGICERTGIAAGIAGADDIVYGGKKLCGILCEMMCECESGQVEFAAIGMGIRVYMPEEESETSLGTVTGRYYNRSELISAIVNRLYEQYTALQAGEGERLLKDYRRLQAT